MIFIPNAETHEKWNLIGGAIAGTYLFLQTPPMFTTPQIVVMLLSLLLGTFYFNPDLDTGSRARKRWWLFGFIWKPFNHRGILHSPLLYIGLFVISLGVAKFVTMAPYAVYAVYAPYLMGGIVVSAFIHILADKVMDIMHIAEKII